jgi:hypothetical protein
VVYVARSLVEGRRVREALLAAGLDCDQSDAALAEQFAAGQPGVQLRVSSEDFARAMEVVDQATPAPSSERPPVADAAPDEDDPELARARKKTARKLLWRAAKALFLNSFSLVIVPWGALIALVGVAGVLSLLGPRAGRISPEARYMAWIAFLVGLVSIAWGLSIMWPDLVGGPSL